MEEIKNNEYDISNSILWRNKNISCDHIRTFENKRKSIIDLPQKNDKQYWLAFEELINKSRDINKRIHDFFNAKLVADISYAESLYKLRSIIESPTSIITDSIDLTNMKYKNDILSIDQTSTNALNSIGKLQEEFSEKIIQFTNIIKRDLIQRPLEEMINAFEEKSNNILNEGKILDNRLNNTHKRVIESFNIYDNYFREMESLRLLKTNGTDEKNILKDLWLVELNYCTSVKALRNVRREYVQEMAGLFQQFKNIELLRNSVIQNVLETYIQKQKLLFEELTGSLNEAFNNCQKIVAEKDVLNLIRRLPKNNTALSLSSGDIEFDLFESLKDPLSSPMVVKVGLLKQQIQKALFKSWKDCLCVLTFDKYLHVFDIQHIDQTTDFTDINDLLFEIANCFHKNEGGNSQNNTNHSISTATSINQNTNNNRQSILINNSSIAVSSPDSPCFELSEIHPSTGLFTSLFSFDNTKNYIFQGKDQSDLLDWIVALKQFTSR